MREPAVERDVLGEAGPDPIDGQTGARSARQHGLGDDREARINMAMAAMEGAMVFQKGLGAVHALSHPTGGLKGYRTHHGTLNAIYLPAVLRFNEPAVAEKYKRVAATMGLPEHEANATGVANAVAALNERLGIPKGLGAMGLGRDTVEKIADGALGDHCHLSTPRQPTKAQYIELIEQSWG